MTPTGGTPSSLLQGLFPITVNVGEEALHTNIRSAVLRDVPWLQQVPAHNGRVVIVAGGPSLSGCAYQLKKLAEQGWAIIAVNNTAQWLLERGIVPTYHVILDARPELTRFLTPYEGITYLLASQCAPAIFDAATGPVILWHPNIEGIQDFIGEREAALIGGGTTVGLQAMSLAYTLGYRVLHLVGFDSSYRDGDGHAYAQPENDGEPVIQVAFAGRTFTCARWMIHQVEEFKGLLKQLVDLDCTVTVAGDGFLQETMREMLRTTLTAVYDLAVSPPTYEFLSFLCAAEKARLQHGHTYLDVVFMPGPKDGFRDDALPPSLEERHSMLHRICVSACRLLPSVRTVTVRADRQPVSGTIFPDGWTVLTPVSHYGMQWVVEGLPQALRATEYAKKRVRYTPRSYITITLRQSSYWPERNSNLHEWTAAARVLQARGYEVVWVPDTDTSDSIMSWDIDFRLALYEGAACNLMIANGPLMLAVLSTVPYLAFKMVTEACPSTTPEFMRQHGYDVGFQFSANGRCIWKEDTCDTIVDAVEDYLNAADSRPRRMYVQC